MHRVTVRDSRGSRTYYYRERWQASQMAHFLQDHAQRRDIPREVEEHYTSD